jgi:Lrp/AsnC family leucine-responsive transcriptional regulator
VYVPFAQNVSCIFNIFKSSQHKNKVYLDLSEDSSLVYILNRTEYVLDRIDRKILSALRGNGRLTVAQLAEEVGLSSSPCWTRLKRLETLKIIEGYTVNVNPKAIGIHEVFFIEITLERHDDEMLENFSEALADIPEVVEAHLVTGDYDYLVKVAVKDADHYERFLRKKLYSIKGIRHTRSTFALRPLKSANTADLMLIE